MLVPLLWSHLKRVLLGLAWQDRYEPEPKRVIVRVLGY